jgi:hypothetical protein
MTNVEHYREYAADCILQAENEATPEDKNILLNVALAWVRLAQQTQELGETNAAAEEDAESEPDLVA